MSIEVPSELHELLTPTWMTTALAERYPGITVTSVTPGPVVSRVATNARFSIDCAGGLPDGLASHLCVKGYFSANGHLARPAGVIESLFYRDVLGTVDVGTLNCVYVSVDLSSLDNVIITEDVAEHGAMFLDGRHALTLEQIEHSLDTLARLHASTWMRSDLASVGWLASRLSSYTRNRGVAEIAYNFDGPIGAGVPVEVRDAERLYAIYKELGTQVAAEPAWCLIHGDAHIGNVFLDRGITPTFVDWQLVQRAPWYVDVGYHISSSLAVEDRRTHEATLLRHYLARLSAAGGPSIDEADAWRGFGRGALHGFYLWAITLKVDPEITSILQHRLGSAVADHDVYTAVTAT